MNVWFEDGCYVNKLTLRNTEPGKAVLIGTNWFLQIGYEYEYNNEGDVSYVKLMSLSAPHNFSLYHESKEVDDIRDVVDITLSGVAPATYKENPVDLY